MSRPVFAAEVEAVRPTLRPAFAGAAATFSGIGLSRFAYVPLFPAMVSAGWVSGGEAGTLGAVNLAGYLLGVLGSRTVARRLGTPRALDLGMAMALLAFAACALNGGVVFLGLCRFGSGVAGGLLMALIGPAVQGAVDPTRRGLAGGITMTGVAVGVIAGSLGVPLLLKGGVAVAWLGLAVAAGILWLAARPAWPATPVPPVTPARAAPGVWALCAAYGISGAGLVPHMVYFGDHVIRGRGLDPLYGSLAWLLFGLGGLLGPLLGGRLADRIGPARALPAWLALQVVAVLLAFGTAGPVLAASALLGGFAALGLTAIALARARDLAGAGAGLVWVQATAAFAIAQATTGFLYATIFSRTGSHDALFATGLALSVASLLPVLRPLVRPTRTG